MIGEAGARQSLTSRTAREQTQACRLRNRNSTRSRTHSCRVAASFNQAVPGAAADGAADRQC